MKNMYLIIVLIMAISFLLLPLLATEKEQDNPLSDLSKNISDDNQTESALTNLDEIKLYIKDEEKTISIAKNEYLIGVLAAEISVDSNIEALKAQALASFTYAYRKHLQNKESNNEYDLTNDSKLDQGYLNKEERENMWGEKFSDNEKKLNEIINAIDKEIIVYKGEPILATYHALSSGKTETAENIWGTDYPYLKAENSISDLLSPDFFSEVIVTRQDFLKKLTEVGCSTVDADGGELIGKCEKSETGTVLKIELCNKMFSGVEVRELFGLKSAVFDLVFKNDSFIFTVSGYGHGVGMSQFGANYMAEQGSDYKEIIKAYYRDVEIISLKS